MAVNWPQGISSSAVSSGIKPSGDLDLGMIVAEHRVRWAGTFTRNAAAAACVEWSRGLLGLPVRGIVANSGNANACTGEHGKKAVEATAAEAASAIGCNHDEILVASTGPIGVQLPIDKVIGALPNLASTLSQDLSGFSTSILTTDTRAKVVVAEGGGGRIVGVAKGAAMCKPDMATMLAFIATDADVGQDELQGALTQAVDASFNRISVDGCESTNDSVFLLAGGTAAVELDGWKSALAEVCRGLAHEIVRDSEGGHRVVRIQVAGAQDEAAAVRFAHAVADSALWRSSVYGADPNWGRILAALGTAERDLWVDTVTIAIGSETLFDQGEPVGSLEAAAKEMQAGEFTVHCTVGSGPGVAEVLSADLSPDYVTLNAAGT
jgi:glutamate N-acetyltransferase/amino-acid N-acetyltransferase